MSLISSSRRSNLDLKRLPLGISLLAMFGASLLLWGAIIACGLQLAR
jgi:hypothetical protein